MPELSRRPDPEELLRRVQAEERRERRGRLKVFLGYAPRVGKSLRMFDEGRRRKERGEDVVVAAIQGEITPDVQGVLSQLEVVPTVTERYAGREFQVLDLAALFRRHPEICLIDGLANSNPPGSRNPERWQDVENLLGRGIGVITCVNVQYIRERLEDVARVTGKRASHTVPESFLIEADDIEVVDAPPDELLGRGGQTALDAHQLGELRELALVLAANVVDRQLQGYLSSHGIAATWGVQERILVCLTPRSNAAPMLHSGRRNARRFHGALLAAYFEQESSARRTVSSWMPTSPSPASSKPRSIVSRATISWTPSSVSPGSGTSPRSSSAIPSAMARAGSIVPPSTA